LTRAFEIGETEVTQEQFKALLGYNPSSFRGCGPDCPVEYVTWHEAAAYCNALSARLELTACYTCTGSQASVTCSEASGGASITACPGYRLPTEAEWEYAYRAGSQTGFYDGSEASGQCPGCDPKVDSLGWSSCNSDNKTHPVKQKTPNAWKLYDMAGNVWEWTHDTFVADLGSEPVTDPVGPAALPERAIRGGFWGNCSCLLRGAARLSSPPAVHGNDHGFRCVRSK
jgi:formylglycine-generating enzyme required for sulfatase activity